MTHAPRNGFTLIELLVVLAIMATLLSMVAPRYMTSLDKAKEAALRTNLRLMREAIDKYKADRQHYPESLGQLVTERYLAAIPLDPVSERSDTWVVVFPPVPAAPAVYDVRSGAVGVGPSGKSYDAW
jgi:general secretion pathway protein G